MTLRSVFNRLRPCAPWRDESGVALVALVFVLGSAALVTTTMVLLERTGVQGELEATRSQRANYEKIEAALEVFALRDFDSPGGTAGSGGSLYRLPCPADPTAGNGTAANWVSDACTGGVGARGVVPWATIGLSEDDVVDAKGNYITYIVQTGTMEACNGSVPTTPTLDDENATANANYALIGHGENGLGAFGRNSNAATANPGSAEEQANCQTNCGAGFAANEFRSGPASDTSTDFFDDIVRAVDLANSLTTECENLFGDPDVETAFQGSMTLANLNNNLTITSESMADNLGAIGIDDNNQGTPDDESDDTGQVRYTIASLAFDAAGCAFYEPPLPIRDHTFRFYTEFTAIHDPTDARGNGNVFAILSYDPNVGALGDGNGYTLTDTVCGGTGPYNGYADDVSIGTRILPEVPRLGIEVDTLAHYDGTDLTAGEGANFNRDNFESPDTTLDAWNHVAILGSNNDHIGTDQADTGDILTDASNGDGPLCVDNLTGIGDTDPGDTGENDIDDLTGCYPGFNVTIPDPDSGPDIDVGIIEVGDQVIGFEPNDFHQMRVDMEYEGGSCSTDEIFVQYWLFLSNGDGTGPAECESTTNCQTLTEAFVSDSSEDAAKQACIPWSDDIQDDFMRFGFTFGRETGVTFDLLTINAFSFFAINNTAATSGTTADATDQSREVHNVNTVLEVVDEAYPTNDAATTVLDTNGGLIDLDDVAAGNYNPDKTETGVRLISRNGTLDVQLETTINPTTPQELHNTNGIGTRGIGNQVANEVDMLWQQTTTTPSSLGVYPNESNPELREAIEIRFYADDGTTPTVTAYERVSLNLGNFSTNSTTNDGPVDEEIIIRAFNGETLVGTEQVIDSCTDGDTSNPANSMFLSLDYTGTPVDKLILIPNYLDSSVSPYPEDEYGSSFYVRGIKGCGTGRICGLTAPADCVTYQGTIPTGGLGDPEAIFDSGVGSGLNDPGVSGLVTLDNVQNHFNNLFGTVELIGIGSASNTVWQNLEGFVDAATDSDDGPVFMEILPDSGFTDTIRFIESASPQFEGITVNSGSSVFTDSSDGEELNFYFQNDWETVLVSFAGFGQSGTQERVIVEGFLDGVSVTSENIITTCSTGNQVTSFANLIFDFATNIGSIDRIRIAPTTRDGGAGSSSIIIHGIRACTEDAACDFTDFGTIQGIGPSNCEATHVIDP